MRDEPSPSSYLEGLPVWVNDPNNVWPTLRIATSAPLTRLEWSWKSRGGSLRDSSSNARAVFIVTKDPLPNTSRLSSHSYDYFRNPFAHVLVAAIEQFEPSKERSWSHVRAFVEKCKEASCEYLLILAASDEALALHRRTIDKLRAEVNPSLRGRERVVTVAPAPALEEQRPITHLHHSPAHQPLLVRLRECIRESAETRIQAYEDEVSRSFLNRSTANWSFCAYFVLKEGMAFTFVQLGRRDLAVRLYDELQAVMNSVSDRGELCFNTFCQEDAADAASGVTNPEVKQYRNLLVQESITELDVRTYLFARQISALLPDRRFAEVAERGLKFITALARRCAEEALDETKRVSAVFRDIWVFCASTALAAALAPAIPSPHEAEKDLSVQLGTPRERHTARLIAGFHVHALKAFVGLANVTLPGCLAPADVGEASDRSADAIEEAKKTKNEKLREALQDSIKAEGMHAKLTNAAASLYEMGGRARGASALDGDAGVIRLRNKSYKEAEALLSAQCLRFTNDNGWDDLHRRQRLHLAQAEKELDRVQEYLVSCLTMLYMSRPVRRRWRGKLAFDDEEETHAKGAAHWVSETKSVAMRLNRVMKYKADRLFEISVVPSKSPWLEGDAATAIVRIKSDIPTDIEVDRITLECRNTGSTKAGLQKPTLHKHSHSVSSVLSADGVSTPTSDSGSPTSPTRNKPLLAATAASFGLVTLQSETPVVLRQGVNNIPVSVGEVHHFGLYKISVVSLFIGNLKLVQPVKRTSTVPTVTIKGSGSAKGSSLAGSPAVSSDFARGDVKFPMFMVLQRDPSAFISIEDCDNLYLVFGSIQLVRVKIVAGKNGIRKGATLTCAMIPSQQGCSFAPEVHSLQDSKPLQLESSLESKILWPKPSASNGEDAKVGEATIEHEIGKGEAFEARIPICLPNANNSPIERPSEEGSIKKSCVIRLHLSGLEEESLTERTFSCFLEQELNFSMPLDISARIQVRSEWGNARLMESNDFAELSYGDGGTLICTIKRSTKSEHTVTLEKISLDTPTWLDLLPGKVPAHVELLPFGLGSSTLFTCAFDLVACEASSGQNLLTTNPDNNLKSYLSGNALEPNLPRAVVQPVDISESQDDIAIWGVDAGPSMSKHPENLHSHLMAVNTPEKADVFQGDDNHEHMLERDLDVEQIGDEIAEEEESLQTKDAEDVVDLSGVLDESCNGMSVQVASPPAGGISVSTLRVEIRIEGTEIPITATLSQRVCMNSLKRTVPRYRIERSAQHAGEIGAPMELQFAVHATNNGRENRHSAIENYDNSPEVLELQYEIDADPTVWIVVGRRRGKLILNKDGSATLVPIVPGRHKVPCVRLFTTDGRGLPPSRYENVNSYMQIVILPCRTVISACSHALKRDSYQTNKMKGKNTPKQKMPQVIASDSFFSI